MKSEFRVGGVVGVNDYIKTETCWKQLHFKILNPG